MGRLTCISILTLCIMIAGLILDNLSTFGKDRECTYEECATGAARGGCSGCGSLIDSGFAYEYYPVCEANGACGWRTGFTKWIKPSPSSPGCPSCASAKNCIESSREIVTDDDNSFVSTVEQFDSEYNYADLCNDDDDDEACMAMNGGNVYIAFTLFALIFNLFTLCLIAPLYCRDTSIFPCDICDEKTHIFLGILYGLMLFCNFIPVVVWMGAADGGMCDNADPSAQNAFILETTNYPGYTTGGLMFCIVADIVACGAVCCCWGDNRRYGDEMDQAKVDRQREKEMYKQKEQQQETEMMNHSQPPQQKQQQQYNQGYNQQPQQYNQQPQQYNQQPQYNQGYNPNQGYNQNPNQYGGQPVTYS